MTDKELSEIKARDAGGQFMSATQWDRALRFIRECEPILPGPISELLANARADIPALLAEVERLQRELAATRNLCGIPSEDA